MIRMSAQKFFFQVQNKKCQIFSNCSRSWNFFVCQLLNFFSKFFFQVGGMLFVLFFVIDDVSVHEAVAVNVVVGDAFANHNSVLDHVLFTVQLFGE